GLSEDCAAINPRAHSLLAAQPGAAPLAGRPPGTARQPCGPKEEMMTKHLMAGVAAVSLFCLAGGVAIAKDDGRFETTIIGSTPGQTIAGVNSGGAPWTVAASEAEVSPSGQIEVEVKGLLLTAGPSVGTTGPVKNVAASVVCGGSGGTVVASTGGVPLSAAGDFEIEQKITL